MLFNAELRMWAAQHYAAAIAVGMLTLLTMRESEIKNDDNLVINAMRTGVEANDSALRFEPREDFEEML